MSGEAHSPSLAQRSSSWLVPGPPVLLLLELLLLELTPLELLLELVLELVLVLVLPPPLLLALELLMPPPEPLLVVTPPGTHCALTLQMYPAGQSRSASTQLFWHMPSWQ